MRVTHSQPRCLFVHKRREALRAAGNMACKRRGRVIAGHEQQSLDKLFHAVAFTRHEIHRRTLDIAIFRFYLNTLVQRAALNSDYCRHELGRARNRHFYIRILFKQRIAAAQNYSAFRAYRRLIQRIRTPGAQRGRQYRHQRRRSQPFYDLNNKHHPLNFGQCLLLTDSAVLLLIACPSALQ